MDPIIAIALIWMLLPVVLLVFWFRSRGRVRRLATEKNAAAADALALKDRFSPVLSIEAEIERLRDEADSTRRATDEVRSSYAAKRKLLDQLERQVAVYDERLSFAELGVYEPHFDFSDSEELKDAIKAVRTKQKTMISTKAATICTTGWEVSGSKAKGQTMLNRQTKLTLRAFNSECEAAIANVRWNNMNGMEKRIRTAADRVMSESW